MKFFKNKIFILICIVLIMGFVFVFTNNKNVSANDGDSKPVGEGYINKNDERMEENVFLKRQPNQENQSDEIIPPIETGKYTGNFNEVKKFVKDQFSKGKVIPSELKAKYKNSVIGKPLYVTSLNDNYEDYFIIPLKDNNTLSGFCTVYISEDGLYIGEIVQENLDNSIFNKDIYKMSKDALKEKYKKLNKKGIEDFRLVYDVIFDLENDIIVDSMNPMVEITTTDGQILYYLGAGDYKSIDENSLNKIKSK